MPNSRASIFFSHVSSRPFGRWLKFLGTAVVDAFLVIVSLLIALLASIPSSPELSIRSLLYYSIPTTLLTVTTLSFAGFYWVTARYISFKDISRLLSSCLFVSISLFLISTYWGPLAGIPHLSTVLLFFFFSFTSVCASRFYQRESSWRQRTENPLELHKQERIVIIGAGDAGETLVREVLRARSKRFNVIGFVDDDPEKQGMSIHGVRVIGTIDDLPKCSSTLTIDGALVAIPSLEGKGMRRILDICRCSDINVKTLPSISALLQGPHTALTTQLREPEVSDLLRRKVASGDVLQFAGYLRGKAVLITGAGGSIGSELARQIVSLPPRKLILLGRGENSIYEIEQELLGTQDFRPTSVICDVRYMQSLERVFEREKPEVVIHAAAHKHVPLMETNPIEAIENNIKGTWNTIQACEKNGVERFILVSTDKAVKPSSIMGASKRVCELMVQAYAQRSGMRFASVRFGNVLGSRGSLVPLLQAQIRRGGPVKITHREMTRFFMTIPEAAQLILEAGKMGEQGEIFILDMGEPVNIKDLAYDLISLNGLVPEKDIDVQFIGTRPGEKLNEELTYDSETLKPTTNPSISTVPSESISLREIEQLLGHLFELCEKGDEIAAGNFLKEIVSPLKLLTIAAK